MKPKGLTHVVPVGLLVASLLVVAGGRSHAATGYPLSTPGASPTPFATPTPASASSNSWDARELFPFPFQSSSPISTPIPTSTPTRSDLNALAPPPTPLEPPDGTAVSLRIRLDLTWTWDRTLGPDDYFQVEIWNDYNDFSTPVDVAWVKATTYKYDADVSPIYGPEYHWRITVIQGIPVREKDWSTEENQVWEPNDRAISISQEGEMWTLVIEPACPPGERSC
jgi:hypothetical protein